jgi:hypothetical protein
MGVVLHRGHCQVGHQTTPSSFLHDGTSPPPNISLIMAAADSGGDEQASGIEDGEDSLTMDDMALGVAAVVQGLDLGLTGLDLSLMFF